MLNKLKKSKQEGFTIIEVMIVLAIAGLIILIVLLAVPALQRNGRNTAIKNDASAIAAAVSEFKSNNEGRLPLAANSATNATGNIYSVNNASGAGADARIQTGTTVTDAAGVGLADPGKDEIIVRYGSTCPAITSGASITTVPGPRSVAIVYSIESSSTVNAGCIEA
jgi:prepilin-type N-terminal cleavage/methylation domain-containing protein